MKRLALFLATLLVACGVTLSQGLVNDANLAIAALTALDADSVALGAPPADTLAIRAVNAAVQTALADLQKGTKTPNDFATLVNDQVNTIAPVLLKDFKANTTITTGVVLLQQMVLLIANDVTAQQAQMPTKQQTDVRGELQHWINGQHHK